VPYLKKFQYNCVNFKRASEHTTRKGTGKRYYSCLRHYAASRKVAGSNLDKVIGFFN
jgi:hypothetical protein